ncbi:glycoside hydrolase family 25 protein [Rhizobium leguminosarum]|uniref:glycoside hydrolase family 25 protein n=1 Tax=Rhizobium leguminosarum TaxID=384 RepID=UPI0013EEA5DB|nr:GH25 family lysozyme [Rhizobium leguminosarum]
MMRLFSMVFISIASFLTNACFCLGQETLTPLTFQDVPRGFLGESAARRSEPVSRGVGIPFFLPRNAKDGVIYGIDISHHSFSDGAEINWEQLKANKVSFVYMKASEGTMFYDSTFQKSWKALDGITDPPMRGAYHFLRALEDPRKQAETFIKVLSEESNYTVGKDLPPVVDLEWDCRRDARGRPVYRKGRCAHDNWSDLKPEEIAAHVATFVQVLKDKFGVAPVVYTSAVWWGERRLSQADKDGKFLSDGKFWIADYTRAAQRSSAPPMPTGKQWTIWQFTDNGKLTEECDPSNKNSNCTDTNAVILSMGEFKQAMGISN